jgi:NSS family neurotransmitter:Na+ symporter
MNTEDDTPQQGQWTGGYTFFLAATGAAVGLGNIWKFPYVAGQNGGGAFVLVYLFFVLIIGIPLFMSELMLGKRGRQSPSQSIINIATELKLSRHWAWLGSIATLSGFLILSYYSVVAGEVLAYAIRTVSGTFDGQSADGISSLYNRFRANPETLLAWHSIFIVITCIVVARGVHHGLEKTVSVLMPLLMLILLMLIAHAVQSGTFINGASFLFDLDFKKLFYARNDLGVYIVDAHGAYQLTFKGILTAMGHAFFTLGLCVGTMIIFGAYLKPAVSIPRLTASVALADTVIALLAGLAIFPIVFAHGLSAAQGPGLVFTTLPIAFGTMEYGNLLGGLFFLLLFFAALTSAIALIEPTVSWLIDKYRMTRVKAVTCSGIACWLLGIVSVFSVTGTTLGDITQRLSSFIGDPLPDLSHELFELTAFQFIDGMVTLVLLPLTGLLIAIFTGWIIRPVITLEDLNIKKLAFYKIWQILVRYVTPVLVSVIFVFGLLEWINTYLIPRPTL